MSCTPATHSVRWKYVAAEDEGQRYKVGKFILETKKVCRSSTWENEDGSEQVEVRGGARRKSSLAVPPEQIGLVAEEEEEEMEFDSQDEDECEDLFMGVWTPQLAARRRRAKVVEKFEE